MWNKLDEILKRYQELEVQMSQPGVHADQKRIQALAKERAGIEELASDYIKYKAKSKQLEETRAMLHGRLDEGMASLVKQEIQSLEKELELVQEKLKEGLRPRDPNDSRDIIMEIRAGTGGDEAALFASDLFRMYSRYAQNKGWRVEVIDCSESSIGGFKEIIFEIKGKGAFSLLKYEMCFHLGDLGPRA